MIRSALIVLAAALAGLLASNVGADPAGDGRVAAGGLSIVPPPGWQAETRSAARVGNFQLADAVVAEAPQRRGRLVVALLPDVVFAQGLGQEVAGSAPGGDGSAPAPEGVRLGEIEAYRWTGLGEGTTLLAAPTSAGAAVIACDGSVAALRTCLRHASTLEVKGAEASALDTLAFYSAELDAAFNRLERRRKAAAKRLRIATRAHDREAAAAALGRAHNSAAESLAALAPPAAAAAAHERLETALRETAAAYERLAEAARDGDDEAFASAARDADREEKALHSAADRL